MKPFLDYLADQEESCKYSDEQLNEIKGFMQSQSEEVEHNVKIALEIAKERDEYRSEVERLRELIIGFINDTIAISKSEIKAGNYTKFTAEELIQALQETKPKEGRSEQLICPECNCNKAYWNPAEEYNECPCGHNWAD